MAIPRVWLACLLFSSLTAAPASAEQIIFSSLGPIDLSRAAWFGFEQGQEGDPDYHFSPAVPFVAGATATLGTVEMPLQFPWSFTQGTLAVTLYARGSDGMPGTALETFTSSGPLAGDGSLSTFYSSVNPLLLAGTTYFLSAATVGVADGLWYGPYASEDTRLPMAYRVNDGPWQGGQTSFVHGFRLTGDAPPAPVPEPSTLLLIGTGLACAARWRRRTYRG
jgi:hypothetical protein